MRKTGGRRDSRRGGGGSARIGALIVLGLAALGASPAQAEVAWLQPERHAATPGALLVFALDQADEFGGTGPAVQPAAVAKAEGVLAGQPVVLTPLALSGDVTRFAATLSRPGLALFEVEFKPEARSISRAKVESYLRDLHATDDIRAAWGKIEEPSPWQEVRQIRLKSFVRVGEPIAGDRTATQVRAVGLDVVPQRDPTLLHENDVLPVVIFRDGRPAAGLVVAYLSSGESRQHVLITDDDGRVEAPLDAKGEWLVQVADVRRAAATNHDWDVSITALTLFAR